MESALLPAELPTEHLWHSGQFRYADLWRYRCWQPGHATLVLGSRRDQSASKSPHEFSDRDHVSVAAEWLCHAQDMSGDGGVIGRYRLDQGWTSSYPETTGYIIPTFIQLAAVLGDDFLDRASRCVEFLLGVQLENGAFPAGEIADNRTRPSTFNSAQIVHGLLAWHKKTGDPASLDAAFRACEWLVGTQDNDGAWRQYYADARPTTYSAYMSCWLAELGVYKSDERFLASANRHLDWLLLQQDRDTGWFDRCGFTQELHDLRISDTHSIAYTLAGILRLSQLLERPEAMRAVQFAATGISNTLEQWDWLPGMLNWQWNASANSAALTGNAQLALV